MNKLGSEPAFPERVWELDGQGNQYYYDKSGMDKRFYAACAVKDDFDDFTLELKEKIVGEEVPRTSQIEDDLNLIDVYSIEYAQWKAKGRAKWRYMQADELLKQENNDKD